MGYVFGVVVMPEITQANSIDHLTMSPKDLRERGFVLMLASVDQGGVGKYRE
ncbi:hypothetical protein RSSM_01824 [Rhodopirellula sallentina SM41]|uniref:Uncharacterized protein n=1 Tax=Rhodopirellula sallentina SM41 TaxID=1263870 RepID=M5U654_9BACT|nr:hypothetical protein RSSM_01824 [Rhodopirellula sallentina SM41]